MQYNTQMQKPTPEQANGYDIVLWLDNDGDIIASPYTPAGEEFIRKLQPDWKPGVHMTVQASPKRFFKCVPDGITVGLMKLDGIETAITNSLH